MRTLLPRYSPILVNVQCTQPFHHFKLFWWLFGLLLKLYENYSFIVFRGIVMVLSPAHTSNYYRLSLKDTSNTLILFRLELCYIVKILNICRTGRWQLCVAYCFRRGHHGNVVLCVIYKCVYEVQFIARTLVFFNNVTFK